MACNYPAIAICGSRGEWRYPLWTVFVLALLLPVSMTCAQPQIPSAIREMNLPLSESAEQTVDQYIDHWIQKLTTGKGSDIMGVCRKLADPLRSAGAATFRTTYSTKLGRRLPAVLKSNRVVVRLNAMMVVSDLVGEGAVKLIEMGLIDTGPGSAAVRFYAARAAARLAKEGQLAGEDQRRVLKRLAALFETESLQPIVEQALVALGSLATKEARNELLRGINKRVAVHAAQPSLSVEAELIELRKLYRKLVQDFIEKKQVPEDWARHMALLGYRYLCLSTKLMHAKLVNESLRESHEKMVELCDLILRTSVKVLRPKQKLPETVDLSQGDQWDRALLHCAEWEAILKKLGFQPEQLKMPPIRQ